MIQQCQNPLWRKLVQRLGVPPAEQCDGPNANEPRPGRTHKSEQDFNRIPSLPKLRESGFGDKIGKPLALADARMGWSELDNLAAPETGVHQRPGIENVLPL